MLDGSALEIVYSNQIEMLDSIIKSTDTEEKLIGDSFKLYFIS